MRTLGFIFSLTALSLTGACSRGSEVRPDDALRTDLALAAQVQPYQAQQFVSAGEQLPGGVGIAPQYVAAPRAPQPVYRAAARRTAARPTARSSGRVYSPAPEQREVIRHTKRDAAIGAVAGAIIGATTSRDKVKGGLIGAAAGGILGGIIGHTIDVKRP